MSQLRKSASFRSRIPVRRQKRSSSPNFELTSNFDPHFSLRSTHHHHYRSKSGNGRRRYERKFSSSSYSSSDESNESEVPLQVILDNQIYTLNIK